MTTENTQETVDTTVQLLNKWGDKLEAALSAIAEKLGVAASEVWEILVRQQFIESVTYLILVLGLLIPFSILFLWSVKEAQKCKWFDYNTPDYWAPFLITSIVGLVTGLVTFCSSLSTIITGFMNPEYGALMDLMSLVK